MVLADQRGLVAEFRRLVTKHELAASDYGGGSRPHRPGPLGNPSTGSDGRMRGAATGPGRALVSASALGRTRYGRRRSPRRRGPRG